MSYCRLSVAGSQWPRIRLAAPITRQPSADNHDHGDDRPRSRTARGRTRHQASVAKAFVEPSVASGRSQRNGVGSPTSWPVARRSPDYNHGVGMVLIEFNADQFIESRTNYAGSAGDQPPPNYPIARRDPGFPRPG